jgi:superfamily II DNA or RNA helicase
LINIFQKAYARKINMAAENALREYEHVLPQANDIRNALWSYRQMQEGKQEPLDEDGVILSKGNIQKQIRKNVATLDTLEKRMHQLGSVLKAKGYSVVKLEQLLLQHLPCLWKRYADEECNKARPCTVIEDGIEIQTPLGARGCKIGVYDTEDDRIEVLKVDEEDKAMNDQLAKKQRVSYYSEEDDKRGKIKPYAVAGQHYKLIINSALKFHLKPYQLEALQKIYHRVVQEQQGYILALSMGLGKTAVALATIETFMNTHGTVCALAVVPLSVIGDWMNELKKWSTHKCIKFSYYEPWMTDIQDAQIQSWKQNGGLVIMSHERFTRFEKSSSMMTSLKPNLLIVDEAHKLKNEKGQMHKVVENYANVARLFLTGTPQQNNMMEFFSILKLVDVQLFPDAKEFELNYVKQIEDGCVSDAGNKDNSGRKKQVAVFNKITHDVMYRRGEETLLKCLPPLHEFALKWKAPALPDMDGVRIFEQPHLIAKNCLEEKMRLLSGLVATFKPAESILIFTKSVEVANTTASVLQALLITGSTLSKLRSHTLEAFRLGLNRTLVMTTQVGSLGLNLANATRVIILDPMWNPVHDSQAVRRAYRLGQLGEVFVYRFLCQGTVEIDIYKVAIHKTLSFQNIVDEKDVPRLFTRLQLEKKTSDFDEKHLDKKQVAEHDISLEQVFDQFKQISYHTQLFKPNPLEKMTLKEEADAANTYNEVCSKGTLPRVLEHGSTKHTITKNDLYFPSTSSSTPDLVPPLTPYWIKIKGKLHMGTLMPQSPLIQKYDFESRNEHGVITLSEVDAKLYAKAGTKHIPDKLNKSKMRYRIYINGQVSPWSDWSATIYM